MNKIELQKAPVKSAAVDLQKSTTPALPKVPLAEEQTKGASSEVRQSAFKGANFSFNREAVQLEQKVDAIRAPVAAQHKAMHKTAQPQGLSQQARTMFGSFMRQLVTLFRDPPSPRSMVEALVDWAAELLGKLHQLLFTASEPEVLTPPLPQQNNPPVQPPPSLEPSVQEEVVHAVQFDDDASPPSGNEDDESDEKKEAQSEAEAINKNAVHQDMVGEVSASVSSQEQPLLPDEKTKIE